KVPWQSTSCVPEVDLEGQRICAVWTIKHPVERRVRKNSTIPIVLTFDLDWRETGRQCAAREDVIQPDLVGCRIEIQKIAAAHVDRPYAKTRRPIIEQIEVYKPLKGLPHWRYIIKA